MPVSLRLDAASVSLLPARFGSRRPRRCCGCRSAGPELQRWRGPQRPVESPPDVDRQLDDVNSGKPERASTAS
jgi:hypothetical protein